MNLWERIRWYNFPIQFVKAIILKFDRSFVSPFLCISLMTDSDQLVGGDPDSNIYYRGRRGYGEWWLEEDLVCDTVGPRTLLLLSKRLEIHITQDIEDEDELLWRKLGS